MTALKWQKNNYGFEWESAVPVPTPLGRRPKSKAFSQTRCKKTAHEGHQLIYKHNRHTHLRVLESMIEERFCEGSPTITCAALIQYLLNNEAKRNIQINEDIGVIKIISCGSYVFLNNEHCGYWRGKIGFFLLIWHTSQISFNQNLSPTKCSLWPLCALVLLLLC